MAHLVVLSGGHSMERDVSLITGRRVAHALERLGHEVRSLDVEESTTEKLMEIEPDAAFICLHGVGGEDQGLGVHGEPLTQSHPRLGRNA